MVFLIQLQRLAPRVVCLVSPPRNSETSTSPAEAKSASSGEVSSFSVSGQSAILFGFGPANEVKERLHRSALRGTGCARPASHRTWRFRRAALVGAVRGACAFCSLFIHLSNLLLECFVIKIFIISHLLID